MGCVDIILQIHLLTFGSCWGSSYSSSNRRHSSRRGTERSGGDGNDGGTTGTSGTLCQTVALS